MSILLADGEKKEEEQEEEEDGETRAKERNEGGNFVLATTIRGFFLGHGQHTVAHDTNESERARIGRDSRAPFLSFPP